MKPLLKIKVILYLLAINNRISIKHNNTDIINKYVK